MHQKEPSIGGEGDKLGQVQWERDLREVGTYLALYQTVWEEEEDLVLHLYHRIQREKRKLQIHLRVQLLIL